MGTDIPKSFDINDFNYVDWSKILRQNPSPELLKDLKKIFGDTMSQINSLKDDYESGKKTNFFDRMKWHWSAMLDFFDEKFDKISNVNMADFNMSSLFSNANANAASGIDVVNKELILSKEVEKISSIAQVWDMIFQTSQSSQSKVIMAATLSEITHVWMIIEEGWIKKVVEAVQPVKVSILKDFIGRGEWLKTSLKRVPWLEANQINIITKTATNFVGKDYDVLFWWDNKKIYCSELTYKSFVEAWIKIWELEEIWDLDFSNPAVQKIFVERLWLKISKDAQRLLVEWLAKYKTPNKLLESWDRKYAWIINNIRKSSKVQKILKSPIITPKSMYESNEMQTIYSTF